MEFWTQIRPNNHSDLMSYWSQTCLRHVWSLEYNTCLQSLTYKIPFLSLFFLLIYSSLILLEILYVLPFRQSSLGKLTLLILSVILAFYVEINFLSRKKTPNSNNNSNSSIYKSNSSHKVRNQNNNGSNIYQVDSIIVFASMATILLLIYLLSPKPLVVILWLTDYFSAVCTPLSGFTQGH